MQTETIEIGDAEAQFKDIVHRVVAGVHIILSENSKPVAHLFPAGLRMAGLHSGAMSTRPDFDAPIPDVFWTEGK